MKMEGCSTGVKRLGDEEEEGGGPGDVHTVCFQIQVQVPPVRIRFQIRNPPSLTDELTSLDGACVIADYLSIWGTYAGTSVVEQRKGTRE